MDINSLFNYKIRMAIIWVAIVLGFIAVWRSFKAISDCITAGATGAMFGMMYLLLYSVISLFVLIYLNTLV